MNIDGFRGVAERPNVVVVVDLKSAQVKVRNNHVLNRAITWLRRIFSPNPLRDTATDAARNKFLQAIADRRSGYDSADVNRARELLADDALERTTLSSRRIREVLDDLDGRSSATTRINRRVAVYFHDEAGITNTLAARDLAANSRHEQVDNAQTIHSDEVGACPPSLANEPGDPVSTSETGTAREDVMAETLTHPSPTTNMESAAVPETLTHPSATRTTESAAVLETLTHLSATRTTESAAVLETAEAPAVGARRTAQLQAENAEVGTTTGKSATPKLLTRELAKAKLPGEVATQLKKLIGGKEIVDTGGLAKHGNKRTAEWVVENRVGRWYVEALKDKGIKRMAGREGTVSVPSSLLNDVAKSIADSPVLKKYPDIKAQARDLIAVHVKQEINQGTVTYGGSAPSRTAT